MARGQQKIQSQAKAAERAAKAKKQQGHNANTQKKAAQKALIYACAICKERLFHHNNNQEEGTHLSCILRLFYQPEVLDTLDQIL